MRPEARDFLAGTAETAAGVLVLGAVFLLHRLIYALDATSIALVLAAMLGFDLVHDGSHRAAGHYRRFRDFSAEVRRVRNRQNDLPDGFEPRTWIGPPVSRSGRK